MTDSHCSPATEHPNLVATLTSEILAFAEESEKLRAEINRLTPYVEAFRREEARADKLETEIDDLRVSLQPATPTAGEPDWKVMYYDLLNRARADWLATGGDAVAGDAQAAILKIVGDVCVLDQPPSPDSQYERAMHEVGTEITKRINALRSHAVAATPPDAFVELVKVATKFDAADAYHDPHTGDYTFDDDVVVAQWGFTKISVKDLRDLSSAIAAAKRTLSRPLAQPSLGKEIAKLMDKHGIEPAKPKFWLELEALVSPMSSTEGK